MNDRLDILPHIKDYVVDNIDNELIRVIEQKKI